MPLDHTGIATRLYKELEDSCTQVSKPRMLPAAEVDLSTFERQERDGDTEVPFEYVDQRGGALGDDYYGTMAFEIGSQVFLVDYVS